MLKSYKIIVTYLGGKSRKVFLCPQEMVGDYQGIFHLNIHSTTLKIKMIKYTDESCSFKLYYSCYQMGFCISCTRQCMALNGLPGVG